MGLCWAKCSAARRVSPRRHCPTWPAAIRTCPESTFHAAPFAPQSAPLPTECQPGGGAVVLRRGHHGCAGVPAPGHDGALATDHNIWRVRGQHCWRPGLLLALVLAQLEIEKPRRLCEAKGEGEGSDGRRLASIALKQEAPFYRKKVHTANSVQAPSLVRLSDSQGAGGRAAAKDSQARRPSCWRSPTPSRAPAAQCLF